MLRKGAEPDLRPWIAVKTARAARRNGILRDDRCPDAGHDRFGGFNGASAPLRDESKPAKLAGC